GCIREIGLQSAEQSRIILGAIAAVLLVIVLLGLVGEDRRGRAAGGAEPAGVVQDDETGEFDAYAGGYPVPPMPEKERISG
ncbi:MAG: hypothetical protein ACRDP6_06180, partial [Actinoallomurus sp.]